MKNEELTGVILKCAFDVSNQLGCGFLEKVYENALIVSLENNGVTAVAQKSIDVRYRGIPVGSYFADILVENRVILEIKATEGFRDEHVAQILNYLRATGMPLGLLLNFGQPKLHYRRFHNKWI
jgi:GxxExxY protein